MTQRNPMNERYNADNLGKTRKSAASAKPKTVRAGTVYNTPKKDPKKKTREEKKAYAEQSGKNMERAGIFTGNGAFEKTQEYRRLRTIWWVCLVSAIFLVVLAFWAVRTEALSAFYLPALIGGYGLIIVAFYIDLFKIRKARKRYINEVLHDKSKEGRAAQKLARAEQREMEKEAQEKYEAAQAEKAAKKAARKESGLFGRFGKSKSNAAEVEGGADSADGADAAKGK